MAGHAKWQNVARDKALFEKKRNILFNRWLPRLRLEAKSESDLTKNTSLQKIYDQAVLEGVPKSKAEDAINCWKNADYRECQFGIQGPGGFNALINIASAAPKKTENDLISYGRRQNFKLANVSFQFQEVKDITCELPAGISEDGIEELALQCGTEEFSVDESTIVFTVPREDEKSFFEEAKALGLPVTCVDTRWKAEDMMEIPEGNWKNVALFIDQLEHIDGFEKIFHNAQNIDEIQAGS